MEYARLWRNRLARRVKIIEWFRAISSNGAIAAWAVWHAYPFVWATIIGLAQLLDASKGVLGYTKSHRAAADLAVALEIIWIDARAEWSAIYHGQVNAADIPNRLAKLRKLLLDAERKHFPDGFEPIESLARLATSNADDYIAQTEGADDE